MVCDLCDCVLMLTDTEFWTKRAKSRRKQSQFFSQRFFSLFAYVLRSLIHNSIAVLFCQAALVQLMQADSLRRFRESSLYPAFLAREPLPLSSGHDVEMSTTTVLGSARSNGVET